MRTRSLDIASAHGGIIAASIGGQASIVGGAAGRASRALGLGIIYRRAAARSSAWGADCPPAAAMQATPVMMQRGGRPLYDV